jgi:hypothetical protein
MANYLTNNETQAALEKIIMTADKQLILVSPFITLTNQLYSRIKAAAEKGVRIKIIYRKDKVKKEELDRLKVVKNIELKCIPDLHAKCYFNEKEMIITSLNLLNTSERNWEMGIRISRSNDKEIYESAMNDVQTIYMDSASFEKNAVKPKIKGTKINASKTKSFDGFCIRCGDDIKFNINKPLCNDCFESWNGWGNEDFPEKFCHFSGEASFGDTDYAHPILNRFWKKAKELHNLYLLK